MALKMWCSPLLEEKVTTRLLTNEGRREQVPCRVELALPTAPWAESYRLLYPEGYQPGDEIHPVHPGVWPNPQSGEGQQDSHYYIHSIF